MCNLQIDLSVLGVREVGRPGETPALDRYDRFVVFFSGGKDSVACVLALLDAGVTPDLIELHHHIIDGREGSDLMDWPVTEAYCSAFAKAMGMKMVFSWKVGGFEREMLRDKSLTAPIAWESETGGIVQRGGKRGKLGTRRKFPQVSADLSVRWCSAYLKVDVGARILATEPRFRQGKTLVLTGERAEESSARARYAPFEPNRADNRDGPRVQRYIDHWRPVHKWSEEQVWDALRRYRINPHPAYWCGWGRTSCLACIFGSKDQWASVRFVAPQRFKRIANYEDNFDATIHRNLSVRELADRGKAYSMDPAMAAIAMGTEYAPDWILVDDWQYPPGAFGESTGPT